MRISGFHSMDLPNLPWPQNSVMAVFAFLVIIFPIQILTADLPVWTNSQWEKELENFRQKYSPETKGGPNGTLPDLIDCILGTSNKTCDQLIDAQMTINEVHLRNGQFKDWNEDCSANPNASNLILNPPRPTISMTFPLNRMDYKIWQEKLIESKFKFCDPLKHLRCSAGGKCLCTEGTNWPADEGPKIRFKNTCTYSEGSPCLGVTTSFRPIDGTLYHNPFNTELLTDQVFSPMCQDGGCLEFEFLKSKDVCVFKRDLHLQRSVDVSRYFRDLKPLSYDEKCNFEDHNRYFTSTKEEDKNYAVRLKNIEDIKKRGVKFCDLQKFLTCGPSEKCECMNVSESPTSRKDEKCVLPLEFDICVTNPKLNPILMNTSILNSAKEKLMTGFASLVTSCEGKKSCVMESMTESYCTCAPGTTGQDCGEKLTKFLNLVRVPSFPKDVTDDKEKQRIFGEFNKKAIEFEKVFKLPENSPCVWEAQNDVEVIVLQIRKLGYVGTTMTKADYDDLIKSISDFLLGQKGQGICKEALRCRYTTKRCEVIGRESYFEELMQELNKTERQTIECNRAGCSRMPNTVPGRTRILNVPTFYGGENEVSDNQMTQEYSKLLKGNHQFCKQLAECTIVSGQTNGTCDCRSITTGVTELGVNDNSRSRDTPSPHNHVSNKFALIMSFATFLIINR